jgi:hypothetical protein
MTNAYILRKYLVAEVTPQLSVIITSTHTPQVPYLTLDHRVSHYEKRWLIIDAFEMSASPSPFIAAAKITAGEVPAQDIYRRS